ncbi:TetR/AcrR family transcriptional regulator [Nocardiopsis deserti]|uniref:TetR/AcrR family transcriptional regulator n=1 Tax=Nocardiopsis deserti TaxID=2605988 RepID=UPI001CC2536B|nr:TetR/AcrR family transcriptional regulator [Nocardiopsis deserti]
MANPSAERPLRADARRNRERVLKVAQEVFAAEGLSVPVHEIARRAGVGTGTVSRHFPTKHELFKAILVERLDRYVLKAEALMDSEDPGEAFFSFFSFVVLEGAMDRGLTEALSEPGFDLAVITSDPDHDVMESLNRLLVRAQAAGTVRDDMEIADIKAILVGCLSRHPATDDGSAQRRLVEIACEGMRTRR